MPRAHVIEDSRSVIIRFFAPKSKFFIILGACCLKRVALSPALLVAAGIALSSCGSSGPKIALPPSQLTTRVLASQSVSSPTAAAGLLIIDGENDTRARGGISAGNSPGLMAISPNRATLLSFDSSANNVDVINTLKETQSGSFG